MAGYAPKDTDEVKRLMDERWSHGDAYVSALPWDRSRHQELQGGVMRLLQSAMSKRVFTPEDTVPEDPLTILDVGCGIKSAVDRPEFLDIVGYRPKTRFILSDLSETAVAALRADHERRLARWLTHQDESYPYMKHPRVQRSAEFEYIVSPAETLPLPDASVDMVISIESIEHWCDVDAALAGIRRVLKPHGALILTTPNRDSLHVRMGRKLGIQMPYCANDHTHEFGYEELDTLVTGAGFRKEAETGASFAPYWALEGAIGTRMRHLTDNDEEVVQWLNAIGRRCPEFAFCQIKAFERTP